jgi:DNA-binding transcriptional LysR family regulator
MDLNLLVAFDALFRERSVTKAGRRLGLSQPATSAALARLRVALGDDLFLSTPRGLEPTARCVAMAAPIAAALDQLRLALSPDDSFDPALTETTFRIGAVDAVLVVLLHAIGARVMQEAPRARLVLRSIDPRDAPSQLEQGEIDLAICPLLDAPARLHSLELFPLRLAVLSRLEHPLSRAPTLDELARYPHVMVSFAGPPRSKIDDAFAAAGLTRHVAVVLSSFLAVPHVLASSDALALVPEPFARELARAGQLRAESAPHEIASSDLRMHLSWPARTHDAKAWQWLRGLIADVLREHVARDAPLSSSIAAS